ncbi:MAG: hypothetical protein OEV43_09625, partial [Coriobacteriia bacterium]|nr:hypothetical protein [Coriobacteriia bacterium]
MILRIGVLLGVFGTPLTLLNIGGNPFGPPKATVLALATTLTAAGFALDAVASADLWAVLRRSRILMASAALVVLSIASVFVAPSLRQSFTGSFPDYRGLLATVAFTVIGAGCVALARRDSGPVAVMRAASATLLAVSVVGFGERLGLPPASFKLEQAERIIST